MSFGDAAFRLLKDRLLPELGEIRQSMGAIVTRLESMERESARRFDLIDQRFDLVDKRFELLEKRVTEQGTEHTRRMELLEQRVAEQGTEHSRRLAEQGAEHTRRMDLLDRRLAEQGAEHMRRMDLLDRRLERLEATTAGTGDRVAQLAEAVARLGLLGDYVRRVDEMSVELRELRRKHDEFERRIADEVLPRLPKVGT